MTDNQEFEMWNYFVQAEIADEVWEYLGELGDDEIIEEWPGWEWL